MQFRHTHKHELSMHTKLILRNKMEVCATFNTVKIQVAKLHENLHSNIAYFRTYNTGTHHVKIAFKH